MEKCNLRPAAPIFLSNRTHGQFACQLPHQITRDTAAQRKSASALSPGEPRDSPTAYRIAMTLGVLVAFEAFEDIVGIGVTGLGRNDGGLMRARARAAQEHHRRFGLRNSGLKLIEKLRIALTARVGVPFDQHRFGNMPD